jgi:hypothetical protein
MLELEAFAKKYYRALSDIATALPSTCDIPKFISSTSFVIACSDRVGRVSIDIVSQDNIKELVFNGKTITPLSADEPGFLIAKDLDNLTGFVFPQDDKGSTVSLTIGNPNVILDGLAFSSKEYNEKHWYDKRFYRNCGGSIPFMVTATGSMLGIDLLWGTELGGRRQERLFEFIKMYGNQQIAPYDIGTFQDEAFKDIGHVIPKLGKELDNWSFTGFISDLRTPVEQNVLILGSYISDKDFDQTKSVLRELGYHGFLLKDSPDLPIQSNLEKLFSGIICSCFIIVIDKTPSGHIAELSTMLQFRFRPVIVLRDHSKPTTSFLEDRLLTDKYFRIAVVADISVQTLLPYISWAKGLISEQINNFNRINSWRME